MSRDPHRRAVASVLVLLAAGALSAGLPAGTAAQNRSLVIQQFKSDILVQSDGDVQVTETLTARFTGSWNGIYRDLSLQHQTAQGRRARLDVDFLGATDADGNKLKVRTPSRGHWTKRFQIYVPGAENATRTVVLRYVVHNVIRFFEAGSRTGPLDELYWNATGNDWAIPLEASTVTVRLPEGVSPTQSAGYTGVSGSTERAVRVTTQDDVVTFTATRALTPGEGLTIAVGWPPGSVARPGVVSSLTRDIWRWLPLLLPFLAFYVAFGKWRRYGKDPHPRTITVQYDPPESLSPAEVGTLVDGRAQIHDVTSTLVDLAVRGFVHIEEVEHRTLGVFKQKDYHFRFEKPRGEWAGLQAHEEAYLSALYKYADGDTVALSKLKNKFYKDLGGIQKAIYEELVTKGHYDRAPDAVRSNWIALGIVLLMAGVSIGLWMNESGKLGFLDPLTVGVGIVVSGVVMLIFAQIMPARTVKGARAREHALGFKQFLERVEEPRFSRMITSPDMFERFLAYAMSFKVEAKWAKAFEGMYSEPPRWYSGSTTGAFHVSSFTQGLGAMTTAASSTMSSSPSGSGGGGSSGGGSGGGGGGGF